jgi:hypothetical protein
MSTRDSDVIYEALRRECASVTQHLGIGATAIGRAYFEATEFYAQAFFALSVGFERASKLVLTLDAAASDAGAFMDGPALRAHGHSIQRLLTNVEQVAAGRGFARYTLPATPIHQAIIAILSDFASNLNRYYNLEVLQPASRTGGDPIAAWYTRVTRPVLEAHRSDQRRRSDEAEVAAIALPANLLVSVIASAETGEPIVDLQDLRLRKLEADVARPWERMYVLQIARFVTYVLGEIGHVTRAVADVPFLEEYFYEFQVDDADFRRRKIWPPRR